MKTIAFTFIFVVFGYQNSSLAETVAEAAAPVPAAVQAPSEASAKVEEKKAEEPKAAEKKAEVKKPEAPPRRELKNLSAMRKARVTFYNPDVHNSMEGGPKNRYGEAINSVENAIKNGRPVTVAADYVGTFGELCNQRYKRCTLLIRLPGFDTAYPSYRKKFPNLPKHSFIAIVEDTGGAFVKTAGARFDIAVRSRKLQNAIPPYMSQYVKWVRLHNPCGQDEDSRDCRLSDVAITGEAKAAMGLSGRDL